MDALPGLQRIGDDSVESVVRSRRENSRDWSSNREDELSSEVDIRRRENPSCWALPFDCEPRLEFNSDDDELGCEDRFNDEDPDEDEEDAGLK